MAGNEQVVNFGEFKRRREGGNASMTDLIQKLKDHVAAQRNILLEGLDTNHEYDEHETLSGQNSPLKAFMKKKFHRLLYRRLGSF